MGIVPQFSAADLAELRKLGVSDNQVMHLQHALVYVRRVISRRPRRRETIALLKEIETLTRSLSRKLELLVTQPEPEYGYAHQLIEETYWERPERQDDEGPTSSHHLLPRLRALEQSAAAAHENVPAGQSRQTVADPRAVTWIKDALLNGWLVDNPHDDHRALPPYPKAFTVSKAMKSPFRKIAGICFRTVGGNADPLRAIETYLSIERKSFRDLYAAFEDGWEAVE